VVTGRDTDYVFFAFFRIVSGANSPIHCYQDWRSIPEELSVNCTGQTSPQVKAATSFPCTICTQHEQPIALSAELFLGKISRGPLYKSDCR
jgi:hypothetical protein